MDKHNGLMQLTVVNTEFRLATCVRIESVMHFSTYIYKYSLHMVYISKATSQALTSNG